MATPYRRRSERGFLAAVGRLLYEIRYPTTGRGKIIVTTLATLVFLFLILVAVGGFLLERVLTPPHAGETLDPTRLIGATQAISFETPDGVSHNAWFFPGVRRGPVIIALHGYRSSRSEVLTLASSLQEHRYNVVAFNFAGHGESPSKRTKLGFVEAEELRAAIQMLSRRTDINSQRIGLWGHSLGAYAALSVAVETPAVKALVLDSAYVYPADLLGIELRRIGAHWVPVLRSITRLEFWLYTFAYRSQRPEEQLDRLAGIPKLFFSGSDQPILERLTRELFDRVPGPKEQVTLSRTALAMLAEEERTAYENQVVSFFLTHLPPTAR